MANTYSWNIVYIESKPSLNGLTNVASFIKWIYTGIGPEGIEGRIEGETKIPEPQTETFIPYNSLTKEIVVSWLESTLNISDLQTRVDAQINFILNPPTVVLPLPWE